MFTGLIERTGVVSKVQSGLSGGFIRILCEPWTDPLVVGESVSVDGVCLTVTESTSRMFACDLLAETMKLSTLTRAAEGTVVNLERAIRPGDRMGGHFVTGHVDGIGTLLNVEHDGRDRILHIECPGSLLQWMVPKGSVACDGISLTVVSVTESGFSVHIIPHTWESTSLVRKRTGDGINIEGDILAKYVQRHAGSAGTSNKSIGWDTLRDAGFM